MENTESVINWFKNIPNKHLYKFLMFDLKDFYPSIKEKLLREVTRFHKLYTSITNKTLKQYFMQGNPFYTTTRKRWSKKEKAALKFQWAHAMGQRYVN